MRGRKLSHVWLLIGALLAFGMLAALGVALGGPAWAQGDLAPASPATVSIQPPATSVCRGEEFTVTVWVEDAVDLGAYEFSMTFNPAVVEVITVTNGPFLGSTGRDVPDFPPPDIDNTAGTVTFGRLSLPDGAGPNGDGVLAIITLEAVGLGTSDLHLYDVKLTDTAGVEEIPTTQDGTVTSGLFMEVVPASEEEWVKVGDEFTETVMIWGAHDLGAYEFSMTFNPAVVEVITVTNGPFLGSTGRDVPDFPPPDIDNTAGTVTFGRLSLPDGAGPNGSGALAFILLRAKAVGETDLNLLNLKVADTSGVEEVPEDVDGVVHVVTEGVLIQPHESSVNRCDIFTVTVYVVDAQDLGAYQFDMNWDPTLFYVHDVVNGPFLGSTGRQVPDFPAADIDNDVGTLTFARFSTDAGTPGPTGDGDLAYIIMEAIGVGTSDLDLYDVILTNVAGDPTTPTVTDGTAEATKEAVAFEFNPIADQVAGVPFDITITALDEDGAVAVNYNGTATLADSTGTLAPTEATFVNGVFVGSVTITKAQENVTITAEAPNPCDGLITGVSDPFAVTHNVAVSVDVAPDDETVTAGECLSYTLTAEDDYGNIWDATAEATFTIDADAGGTWTDNVYCSEFAGTWTVTGELDGVSDETSLTVEHAEAVAVTIAPATAEVTAGDCVTYTLMAEDTYGNTWDVTAEATFSIDDGAGGTWTDNEYCSEFAGTWTVTGEYSGLSDDATLMVNPDTENPVAVTIAPATAEVNAGDCVTYTLTASDGYGNTWDVTAEATFSIDTDAGGTWTDNVYCSENAGTWTVTGEWSGLSDDATLTVIGPQYQIFLPFVARSYP